jgi:hypothetical protein
MSSSGYIFQRCGSGSLEGVERWGSNCRGPRRGRSSGTVSWRCWSSPWPSLTPCQAHGLCPLSLPFWVSASPYGRLRLARRIPASIVARPAEHRVHGRLLANGAVEGACHPPAPRVFVYLSGAVWHSEDAGRAETRSAEQRYRPEVGALEPTGCECRGLVCHPVLII